MSLKTQVKRLVSYAKTYLRLSPRDEIYVTNRIIDLLHLPDCEDDEPFSVPELPTPILEDIFALLDGEGAEFDRATLGEKLMDAVCLMPSKFEELFWENYAVSPQTATAAAYGYAVKSDYVKQSAIAKNLKWRSENGRLEITINLSKPEKNNKDLQKQLAVQSTSYPKCTICRENEGFERAGFSRRNMRTISLKLGGEDWFWQYSPYAYFNEHGIAISVEHTPMVLNKGTVEKLFDFVELFPHYFLGNNAPLPRVGGSILMHNHYQGGGTVLPMQKAEIRFAISHKESPAVSAGVVDWYNSAIRLEGEREAVAALAVAIFTKWKEYENAALEILPYTGSEAHNTASCIARKTEKGYLLDLILRNNRVNERYPDGIFHAHREYHHIKSESIGLIEAMGLFVLPARLARQLTLVKEYLTGERAYAEAALPEDMKRFVPMIERLRLRGGYSEEEAKYALKREVEEVCEHILENTAVFPNTAEGEGAFKAFLSSVGFTA